VIRLLVVDDSPLMRRLLGELFAAEGDFDVAFARNGAEALAALRDWRPDVITLVVRMPEMDGIACLDRIMIEQPTPVVMFSAVTTQGASEAMAALALGAVEVIPKPSGAVSLKMDEFGPPLVDKVRAAAAARLPTALRLRDRVRARTRLGGAPRPPAPRASRPRRPKAAYRSDTGLVVVGSSTGGPPALDAVLSVLPADYPWPIVIAQHMPASFTGPLAKRLDRLCALKVQEVSTPCPLAPGNVYIGKGDADVIVVSRGDRLLVTAAPPLAEYRWHPSVDRLVTTAMQRLGPHRLIGVLLTGMGNDGAVTMTKLRADGGRTIAEAEESAVVWGMPGELVKSDGADVIAPIETIASHLTEWTR